MNATTTRPPAGRTRTRPSRSPRTPGRNQPHHRTRRPPHTRPEPTTPQDPQTPHTRPEPTTPQDPQTPHTRPEPTTPQDPQTPHTRPEPTTPQDPQTPHTRPEPTAPWGLRGSPPQNNDGRPGEVASATEQGRPEAVGAVEALSTLDRPVRRLLELAKTWPKITDSSVSVTMHYRTARQLRSSEIDELVASYQAGATVFELAARFNIHRSTVGRHLKERGIDTRGPILGSNEVQEAVDLYQAGWTLDKIAKRHGVGYETIRRPLSAHGIEMRPRGRRPADST